MRGEGNATLDLEAGNYAWVCFVPGPDGVSHVLEHNQAHAFVAPEASLSLRMLDAGLASTALIGEHGEVILTATSPDAGRGLVMSARSWSGTHWRMCPKKKATRSRPQWEIDSGFRVMLSL